MKNFERVLYAHDVLLTSVQRTRNVLFTEHTVTLSEVCLIYTPDMVEVHKEAWT